MQTTSFVITPIAPAEADRLRAAGGPTHVADSTPGYPCRQCLRDAEIGDELVLVPYDPFEVDSPYRCSSPIFLHLLPCQPYEADGTVPDQLALRQLSVRAFDASATMRDAEIVEGTELADAIERLMTDPEVDRLHVHNAVRGCWATTVRRH